MTIVDRYVFLLFAKVFGICFASLAGLFIIVHLFTNLDDLLRIPTRSSEIPLFLFEFYWPRVLDFWDRSASILSLTAACFALAMMQRRRELVAIESAGVCRQRLLRPIFIGVVLVTATAFWNREYLLPQHRDLLVRTPQTWNEEKQRLTFFQKDHRTGLLVKGAALDFTQAVVDEPIVQIPLHVSRVVHRLSGKTGKFSAADGLRPAGLLIEQLDAAEALAGQADLVQDGAVIVYFAAQHDWLPPQSCFVVTDLTFDDLAFGEKLTDYASVWELVQGSSRPTQWYSRGARVTVHRRLVRPILEVALLLVALPLVLTQTEHRLWRALSIAIVAVAGCQLLVQTATVLGTIGWIPSAALAAWLPLFVLLPLTPWTLSLMRR